MMDKGKMGKTLILNLGDGYGDLDDPLLLYV